MPRIDSELTDPRLNNGMALFVISVASNDVIKLSVIYTAHTRAGGTLVRPVDLDAKSTDRWHDVLYDVNAAAVVTSVYNKQRSLYFAGSAVHKLTRYLAASLPLHRAPSLVLTRPCPSRTSSNCRCLSVIDVIQAVVIERTRPRVFEFRRRFQTAPPAAVSAIRQCFSLNLSTSARLVSPSFVC